MLFLQYGYGGYGGGYVSLHLFVNYDNAAIIISLPNIFFFLRQNNREDTTAEADTIKSIIVCRIGREVTAD